ncbi:MAG: PAS domain S-box protein [Candidatus Methylumidiphilus sp.]
MRNNGQQSETELKATLLEALVESSNDAIISKDLDGKVITWNQGAEALFGYGCEEMLGKAMLVLFPPGREEEEQAILHQIQQGKKVENFETLRLCKDGALIDVSVTISPIRSSSGQIIGASKIARDITRQKQLEMELEKANKNLEDLYNNAPCGYHSLDGDGIIVAINDTELTWLGLTREQVVGKRPFTDFITEAGKELFSINFPQFKQLGLYKDVEFELVSQDGSHRFVSMSATAIRDTAGNFLRSRTVLYDISELKKTQEELRQISAEQKAMLNNNLIGIVKLKNRQSLWANPEFERIFGYEKGGLIDRPSRILYLDDAAYEALGRAAYPYLQANKVYRTQIELLRKTGEKIWVDVSGAQLPCSDQESMWMMRDISEQVAYQQKIENIAYHDILTGLPNRLMVTDRLHQALAQAARSHHHLAVCYLDLDGFKPVNDQFGHAAGDKLLIEIASRMLAAVRPNDTVGRLGGDEFVLLLTHFDTPDDCGLILDRLLVAINVPIDLGAAGKVTVGASIGVTLFPEDNSDTDLLLRHADQAMYQAKKSGRNQICMYGKLSLYL